MTRPKTTHDHEPATGVAEAETPVRDEKALTMALLAAVTYIESHLFEPMTVKSIADHAGFSPSRVSSSAFLLPSPPRCRRSGTGSTPSADSRVSWTTRCTRSQPRRTRRMARSTTWSLCEPARIRRRRASSALGQFTRTSIGQFTGDEPAAYSSGGQGLVSTADDYLTFARMLLGKGTVNRTRLLKRETVELMTTNRLTAAQRELPFLGRPFWKGMGFGLGMSVVMDPAEPNVRCAQLALSSSARR